MAESVRHTEAGGTGAAGPAKVMTSSPVNGHASPAHQPANQSSPTAGKQTEILTPPSVSEKKLLTNGHASPVRLPANSSNNQTGVETLLKTDDRMRLARERREERERSLAMREQALMEKERRARLQYERTREERWRRLEEQRQKEEQRRAAVEEKRRQQLEEEKERLEALMRKSLERSLQLENRNKRGTWGINGQSDYALPHDLIASFPATNELGNVPSSPHRLLYCASPGRRRANTVTMEIGRASSAPNTPKKEKLRTERRTPAGSPVRRADSPADVIRRGASPKMTPTHGRDQSLGPHRYPSSPVRHRPSTLLTDEKVSANRQRQEVKGHDPADEKPEVSAGPLSGSCKAESPRPAVRSPDRLPLTSGRVVARTTDGDLVAQVLAERRHLGHKQKDHDEKDRLNAEQLKKNQEERKEEKRRKANKEKELQEKQDVERELMKQQEEQERQQRKKRIEEIMKRTRKSDGQMKREDSQEPHSPPPHTHSHTPSLPGEVHVKGEVKAPPTSAQVKPHTPESFNQQQSAEKNSHTPAQVLHNTPALNPPDYRVGIAPVTPQRSSSVREEQSTQVRRISCPSEKPQEAQVKISSENYEKKPRRESPDLSHVIKQQSAGQDKGCPSDQVKTPTCYQMNSEVKNPTPQRVNSQVKSPTPQQVNSQVKSPTPQQANSQVKSPTPQQANSQVKSPTPQQANSQVKSPTPQQVNSQVKSPTSQQVNSQVKSPTPQQVNSPVKSPTPQQVNSQVKSPTPQQVNSPVKSPNPQQANSQVKSPTPQQVNSPVKSPNPQQANSQVKSPTPQQMNSEVKNPTPQQANSQVKSPTPQQVNSPVKSPTPQQANSQVKSPTPQQANSQVKSPTPQQANSQVKSPTPQQVNSQVKSPTPQQANSQVKSPTPQQVNSPVKSPTPQQANSQVKSPTPQQANSPVKSPTPQQANSQVKSPTPQQANSQVKSPTPQQANSQVKSPTPQELNSLASQQVISSLKSPNLQLVNSPVKSPALQQVHIQVKGPTPQLVNSQANSLSSHQVNSQVKSPSSQEGPRPVKTTVKSEQVNGQMSPHVKTVITSSQGTLKKTSGSSSTISPLPPSQFPPTFSDLEYLGKGGGARKDSADAVQSLDVSSMSKEELISIPKFSPISEVRNVGNSTRALEDLLDLTGHVTYPIMQGSTTRGDCNRNVIEPNTLNTRSRKE